jgi:hypothetical protein
MLNNFTPAGRRELEYDAILGVETDELSRLLISVPLAPLLTHFTTPPLHHPHWFFLKMISQLKIDHHEYCFLLTLGSKVRNLPWRLCFHFRDSR